MPNRSRYDARRRGALMANLANALEIGESEAGAELLRRLAIMAHEHPVEFHDAIAGALAGQCDVIELCRGWRETTEEAQAREPARVIPFVSRGGDPA